MTAIFSIVNIQIELKLEKKTYMFENILWASQ